MSAYAALSEERKAKIRAGNKAWHAAKRRSDPAWAQKRREARKRWYGANAERVAARNIAYRALQRRDPLRWITQALYQAKARAARKSIPFDISAVDIATATHCPVLGVELIYGASRNDPHGPSLDRSKPELGYVRGNVRVISNRANTLKRDATLEEVRKLLNYMERLR